MRTNRIIFVLITFCFLNTLIFADAASTSINWTNVEGPYRFDGYCSPRKGVHWGVGGLGTVYVSTLEENRDYKILGLDAMESFYGVWFNASGSGWVVGEDGLIFHSTDNGYSWVQQQSGTEDTLKAITCLDSKNCWILGDNVFLRTRDAGEKWSELEEVNADQLDFVNLNDGWASDYHHLYRTRDSGTTWTKLNEEEKANNDAADLFQSIEFINKKIGWAAGEGKVGYTSDGGKSWKITKIEDSNFVGIASADKKKATAVNRGRYNYCTSDMGKTWDQCGIAEWAKD